MSIASADLMKSLNSVWDASGLDALFEALWSAPSPDHDVFNDQQAGGGQPFPYMVMDQAVPATVDRMSRSRDSNWEIRDTEVRFNVHARDIASDSRTAKQVAAYLVEEIAKVFGGHPTVAATGSFALDNGEHLITQYVSDFGIRTGSDEYQWVITYLFRLDIPVMV